MANLDIIESEMLPATLEEEIAVTLKNHPVTYSLPRDFYTSEEYFNVEMKQIFEKEWLFVGLTCEIPRKGNYITQQIAGNPVVIVRDQNNEVKAFHNVCRHRGSKICLASKGKAAKLVCPYHQWTYELDGDLLFAGTEMGEDFDLKKFHLKPVNCKTAGGYIFISLSKNPPNIDDFFETLAHYLEPYDLENAKVASEKTIMEDANWKLVIENNRECYHCNGSHPELLGSLLEWDDTDDPRATDEFKQHVASKQAKWDEEGIPHEHKSFGHAKRNRIVRMPLKEGIMVMTMDGKLACDKLMGRIKNPDLGSMRILHLPNSWNHAQSDHLIAFQVRPISATKTEVTTKWIVHKDAVEGKDYDVDNLTVVWDQTNLQDRTLAENNQRGINSSAYEPGPYSPTYEFGVINFIDWFSHTMQANLNAGGK
ncbi:aromatic ring-hydroxylating oxygenase subunit alpha [Alteromonas lipolytica]|nr:aromatic ring-hydroxylating dioxygenase subunit alpha [Alteromonas lipolytica]GGF64193.1 (2Fe-2S)-binding protein [Alteromonas lipolytica]